ncbi:MAG: hypothetical protein E3J82_02910, partial [Candidatus Thorarchaeota archaeon]
MTGFPWPLSLAQEWFDDLYDWVGDAAVYAVQPVSQWIVNTQTVITGFITTSMDNMSVGISGFIDGLWTDVNNALGIVITSINANISALEGQFTVSLEWWGTVFSDSIIGLQTGMDAAFTDAGAFVDATVTGAFVALNANIDAAIVGIGTVVPDLFDSFLGLAGDVLAGLGDALGPAISTMWVGLADGAGAIATGILGVTDVLSETVYPFIEAPLLAL